MFKDVKAHVSSCHECQIRSTQKVEIPLTISTPATIFTKLYVDVMLMPKAKGYCYIVAARDDLTQAAEGRALRKSNADSLAKFFSEEIICRYGHIAEVVTDNGEGIVKACEGGISQWPSKVHHAFFADKVTMQRASGFSPFWLLHGVDPILPFNLVEANFLVEGFKSRMASEDLLALRIRQLEKHPEDIRAAAETLAKNQWSAKLQFEKRFKRRFLKKSTWEPGDLVLVRDIEREHSYDRKHTPRYRGPYKITGQTKHGSYILSVLDGTLSRRGIHGYRLLPYISRQQAVEALRRADKEIPSDESDQSEMEGSGMEE
ncbi:hypothetical protein GLOTRDRAFT_48519 [Gloeophyllum trabeum ATCC 11539]|uniref:Integrase catalytic domain-containing protein n=1 Tax=Gloeophyllum trabeum (strain ATCC 11539 / FP-39264 / Madison 617) TaxID=670483 RepID=S7PUC8_GLOTA|nr:uncharacterized protein GLOTRDRAFT_48519 [Gloeophyllum trabeum ATCC 11539]EPQ51416.1 hypothetical protein GLOTRDRAFT_48519 [Gloeophyllum trabeum ATCC 11539]